MNVPPVLRAAGSRALLIVGLGIALTCVLFTGQQPPRSDAAVRVPASDVFDDWVATAGSTQFTASHLAEQGTYALQIDAKASGSTAVLAQPLQLTVGSTARVTARVMADHSTGDVRLGLGDSSVAVPAGTYGWRSITFTTRPAKAVERLTIGVAPGSGRVRLDQVTVTAAPTPALHNGGFESNSRFLRLTDTSLVETTGEGMLHLRSRESTSAKLTWTLVDERGRLAGHGSSGLRSGQVTVPIRVPAGYYRFTVRSTVAGLRISRSANVAVVDRVPAQVESAGTSLGIGLHIGAASNARFDRWVNDLKRLGLRYARTDVWWGDVERTPGHYVFPALYEQRIEAMQRAGLRPLLIPGYRNPLYDGGRTPSSAAGVQAYARFVAALAAHYPTVDIDVYNEFDTHLADSACGHTAGCYLPLLRATSSALGAVAPSTRQVSAPSIGGMGVRLDWLDQYIAQGGLSDSDALSFHPYIGTGAPGSIAADLTRLRATMAAHGGGAKPIWFTEFGYSTAVQGISESTQAAYIPQSIALGAQHGVSRIYWYDGFDDGPLSTDIESRFGLFRRPSSFAPSAWQPKPAVASVATAQRLIAGRAVESAAASTSDGVHTVGFAGGTRLLWAESGSRTVTLPNRSSIFLATGESLGAVAAGTPISVGPMPVYVIPRP